MGADTKIEWCDATWNPITGCHRGCPYCYAREMAKRFSTVAGGTFRYRFWPARLKMVVGCKKPKRIFVGSMADMFGAWVRYGDLRLVFDAAIKNPQHIYYFLTKDAVSIGFWQKEFMEHANFWAGFTATDQEDYDQRFDAMLSAEIPHIFTSLEPLHGPITLLRRKRLPAWVIVGEETGNRPGKVICQIEWVESIVRECRAHGIPVFVKKPLPGKWPKEIHN